MMVAVGELLSAYKVESLCLSYNSRVRFISRFREKSLSLQFQI